MIAILDRIKNEKTMAESQDGQFESSDPPQDDEWEDDGDDPDENIIYIK